MCILFQTQFMQGFDYFLLHIEHECLFFDCMKMMFNTTYQESVKYIYVCACDGRTF